MDFTTSSEVKQAACGRWREILQTAGISAKLLDGKGHPCPKCGGDDRFAAQKDVAERGAVICRKCFFKDNGDGIAAVQWCQGRTFPEALRWIADYLGVKPNGKRSKPTTSKQPPPKPDPDLLHKGYTSLIGKLSLSDQHRQNLRDRGLPDEEIDRRGYRSYPMAGRHEIARELFRESLAKYYDVPGFIHTRKRGFTLAGPPGMLVPVRDSQGRIVALHIRQETDGPNKYIYLSSKKYDGPSPGAPIHTPLGISIPAPLVRATEGALAGDIATVLSGIPTIAVPGVGNWKAILPLLKELGVKTIRLAYDADAATNRSVARHLRNFAVALVDAGFALELEQWNPEDGKGIDDVLAAGKTTEVVTGEDAIAAVEEIAETVGASASDDQLGLKMEASDLDPATEAQAMLIHSKMDNVCSLRFWRGGFHQWQAGGYRELKTAEVRADVIQDLNRGYRKLSGRHVSDVLDQLRAQSILPFAIDPPAWIGEPPRDWEPTEILSTQTGLVHLPSLVAGDADHFLPPTPRFFTPAALDYGFDIEAPRPDKWLAFLDQLWADDPPSIETLQEWFGYCLTPDTSLQKIMMMIGPIRSGKGTIARILRQLIGPSNTAGPTLASFGTNFGLWPLLGKTLAIVTDARLGGKTDASVVVERLLSISGEDALTVDRKNLEPVTGKLLARVMLLSNELPRLMDSSGALASRMILLRFTESFYGREDRTLTARLVSELPGILLWAIEGWRRLQNRGYLKQPKSGTELQDELADITSPTSEFVRVCCQLGPGREVSRADLYAAYRDWAEERGRKYVEDAASFGRNLRAVLPKLKTVKHRIAGREVRFYQGVSEAG